MKYVLKLFICILLIGFTSCATVSEKSTGKISHILLDGTSSSGKSTVAKLLKSQGFKHIAGDDFRKDGNVAGQELIDINRYYKKDEKSKLIRETTRKLMFDAVNPNENALYDDIDQTILKFYKKQEQKIYVVVLYAPLMQLTKNLLSRRLTEPRDTFVYTQFAKRYVLATEKDTPVDIINRPDFIKNLETYVKFGFESETELKSFATEIFHDMGIDDDEPHPIKLRDEFCYDLIIDSSKFSPEEIHDQILDGLRSDAQRKCGSL